MSQTGPWSVKGIDARAREAARERARQEGMTLGEYLNSLILKGGEVGAQDIVAPIAAPKPKPQAGASSLNKLVSRIEAAEARSTLAITGIDQSVVGLLKRIEDTETEHIAMARHVDGVMDDIRSTYDALREKVRRIEEDDSAEQNLEALKALENALGKLASHVYEENALSQNETDAIKGRVEIGFNDVNERLESMDSKVEKTLTDAARRVEKAVEQAELRAEGTARHLSERMSTLDSKIGRQERNEEQINARLTETVNKVHQFGDRLTENETKIERQERADEERTGLIEEVETRVAVTETALEDVGTRVDAIEGDVTTALESMEGTLLRVQDRLNRAETTTDAALKSLESTFDVLDQRIGEVAKAAPEHAFELRAQFEERFEGLADDLRASIAATRAELAAEIENVAKAGIAQEQLETFETKLSDVQRRLEDVEETDGSEQIAAEFSKLTIAVEQRLEQLEERETSVIERVGDEMTKIADQLDERISDSEKRSASAIEQVGEQVSRVATKLQSRQEDAFKAFSKKIDERTNRSDAKLSDALANVSERLELMQSQSASTLSPVQKAIASLATRLDSLEEFAAPPFSEAPRAAALPELSPLPINDPLFQDEKVAEAVGSEVAIKAEPAKHSETEQDSPEAYDDVASTISVDMEDEDCAEIAATSTEEFEPGIESWDDLHETSGETKEVVEYTAEVPAPEPAASEIDPVAELENWDEGASEARDTDVFDDVFEETAHLAESGDTADSDADAPAPESANDYLKTARAAARNAAETSGSSGASRPPAKEKSPKAGRVSKSSDDGGSGSSKVPLIATASVVALATAGGTAYYAMKDNDTFDVQKIATPQMESVPASTQTASVAPAQNPNAAPALALEGGADEELFEDAQPIEPEQAGRVQEPAAKEPPVKPAKKAKADKPAPAKPAPEKTVTASAPKTGKPAPALAVTPKQDIPRITLPISLESAASSGDAKAMFMLAKSKLDTGGYADGAALMKRAANAGEPAAQYRLGKLHEKGLGVPRDLSLARKWTERAADGGNIRAMHDLAVFYAQGDGGPQSYAAAVNWFRKAAEFGVVDSQYNLGVLYERGIGIDPDPSEALFWFVIAARGGDGASADKIQQLSKALPVDTADAATSRARNWTPKQASGQANGVFPAAEWGAINKQHILQVQAALSALGYDIGRPDGSVGPSTRKAIRSFERKHNMPSTGRVTAGLIEKINELATS